MSLSPLQVCLEDIQSCFEGVIPSPICTVDDDGTPNVTYLSVVHRVDETHVALSRQFFNKTDANTIVNPYAQVSVTEPRSGRQFQLDLVYEKTVTEGPLFERMRTNLDAVAAHEGMTNVFVLRGTDVCRVEECRMVPCDYPAALPRRDVKIEKLEVIFRRVAVANDMEELLRTTLDACEELFGNGHAFVMLADEAGQRLYTVDSTGYTASGAGSEVPLGEGPIGLAAERRQTVRLTHLGRDLSYSHAIHQSARRDQPVNAERAIPLPAITSVQSQLIVPMLAYRRLVGVICLQSHETGAFQAADEAVMGILASHVAMAIAQLQPRENLAETAKGASEPLAAPIQVKHYSDDDSVFLDNEYLIKGVAGGILWKLLKLHEEEGREEFSNREIRLDQTLELPDIKDNLEARLILLRKRLDERCTAIRMERTSRGKFRLVVSRPLLLVSASGGGPI